MKNICTGSEPCFFFLNIFLYLIGLVFRLPAQVWERKSYPRKSYPEVCKCSLPSCIFSCYRISPLAQFQVQTNLKAKINFLKSVELYQESLLGLF